MVVEDMAPVDCMLVFESTVEELPVGELLGKPADGGPSCGQLTSITSSFCIHTHDIPYPLCAYIFMPPPPHTHPHTHTHTHTHTQCWQDVTNEPVCQQKVHVTVQGNNWS